MLHNKISASKSAGFTLIELLIAISLVGILSTIFFTVFNTSISQYFSLQRESSNFTDLAAQSHRISNVLRGVTEIESATSNEIVAYAYFSPNDAYVSKLRYYKNPQGTKLFVDATDMTSNPPSGTPIDSTKKTYEIIENFYSSPTVNLFEYLSSTGEPLTLPITDLSSIKAIKVNLAVPSGNPEKDQAMSVQVSLRNRKTNL